MCLMIKVYLRDILLCVYKDLNTKSHVRISLTECITNLGKYEADYKGK